MINKEISTLVNDIGYDQFTELYQLQLLGEDCELDLSFTYFLLDAILKLIEHTKLCNSNSCLSNTDYDKLLAKFGLNCDIICKSEIATRLIGLMKKQLNLCDRNCEDVKSSIINKNLIVLEYI